MRVLVTGGAGFIGSHIVEALLAEGHDPVVVDDLSSGKREHVAPGARLVEMSILSRELERVFDEERPECVIHLAAQVSVARSVKAPARDAELNILGSISLLEHCRRYGVRKVIFASSAAVYGEPQSLPITEDHPTAPVSPYGIAKLTVERYLQLYKKLHGLEFTVLRYANVYGPRQDALGEGGVVSVFGHQVVRGEGVTIFGDGRQTRDLVYVEDIARANVLALAHADGETLNVSTAVEISVRDLVDAFAQVVGREIPVAFAPARPGDISRSVLANARARERLGWEPRVSLHEGLARVAGFERARR